MKIILGIDEFTFTIIPDDTRMEIDEWHTEAEEIVDIFFQASKSEYIFDGEKEPMFDKKPAGYTHSYNVGSKDYYLAVAYNDCHPDMGICVRFSAKAWAVYQANYRRKYDREILLPELLRTIAYETEAKIRLSRIDFTADYFDSNIDLNKIYKSIKDDKIVIHDADGHRRIRTLNCNEIDKNVSTIYAGSRKENSKGFLRIYDKRKEQIQTNGFRKQEALACAEWIRFEAVFKGTYAHQITTEMLEQDMNAAELSKYIAYCIAYKYRFFDIDSGEYTDFTKALIALIEEADFTNLRSESPRDNSLHQNISYIMNGSGLFPTLYKIKELYGVGADREFLEHLFRCYQENDWQSPSKMAELTLWLKKHDDLKRITLSDNY